MTRIYTSKDIDPDMMPEALLSQVNQWICRGNIVGCHLGIQVTSDGTFTGKAHYCNKELFNVHLYRINYLGNGDIASVSAMGRCKHDSLNYHGVELYEDETPTNDIESTIDFVLTDGRLIDRFGGKLHKFVKQSIAAANNGEFIRALSKASNAQRFCRHGAQYNSNHDDLIDAIIEMIEIHCNEQRQSLEESEIHIALAEKIRQGKWLKNPSFITVERFMKINNIDV